MPSSAHMRLLLSKMAPNDPRRASFEPEPQKTPEQIAAEAAARFEKAVTDAIQATLDRAARAKGYDNILSAVTYRDSLVPRFAAEGAAFAAWRDAVWATAAQHLAQVKVGQLAMPKTTGEVLALLPPAPTEPFQSAKTPLQKLTDTHTAMSALDSLTGPVLVADIIDVLADVRTALGD